ncbi:MAG: hypothetical protein MI824_18030 [Hyphomicrobiales bacterium]|nr:hypothetical protein [Hyphomicrobiales bacterium]
MDLEQRVTELERKVTSLEGEYGFLVNQIKGVRQSLIDFQGETQRNFETLREDLPGIVGDAVREVLKD